MQEKASVLLPYLGMSDDWSSEDGRTAPRAPPPRVARVKAESKRSTKMMAVSNSESDDNFSESNDDDDDYDSDGAATTTTATTTSTSPTQA